MEKAHLTRKLTVREFFKRFPNEEAGLQVDAKGALSVTTQPSDPRFARPCSGLYWQVSSLHGRLRSRSLWDQELKTGSDRGDKYSWQSRTERGPVEPEILLLERRLTIAGGHQVIIQLAEDQKSVRTACAEFVFELVLFLGALWLVLSGAAAGAAIEAELARAKAAAARQSVSPEAVPARLVAERVVSVVEHTEAGAKLVFAVDVPDALAVPGSAEELSEIIGALAENAVRYARRQVRIAGDRNEECVRLSVEDDGPGLDDWRRTGAGARPAAGRNRLRPWAGSVHRPRSGRSTRRQDCAQTLQAGRS